MLYRKNVIKPSDIPESYFTTQRRLARELGHGDIEITAEVRRQAAEVIITDQKSSLDTWVDYLASPDATYPDWLKYYAMRSILGLGEYDKEKKQFTKRAKGTVKPFPDLNREALAYVLDAIDKKYKGEKTSLTELETADRAMFAKILQGENFAKLYAWAIEKVTPASVDRLTITTGEWKKYDQGSDHLPLVQSLQGHGTGWCTAGESTAKIQLDGGDFYVYYSLNEQNQPLIPRAAIRMQDNSIAEVRGIASDQNLDPYITDVVKKKMQEFPDGEQYEKKAGDMKLLTTLENKTKLGQQLTKNDLLFLYEINRPIEGFGYQRDPRIKELRDKRDPKTDAPIVFECEPNQIAWNQAKVNENTKAYVGPLFANIFQTLKHMEHLYTSFPEGRIVKSTIEIGGKSKEELEKELKANKIQISNYAKEMLKHKDFTTAKKLESTDMVRLKVGDLGLSQNPTTDQIYEKIKELGLELCPAEVGPQYCLQYINQPNVEFLYIGMKQITNSAGNPSVFGLGRDEDGLWLSSSWTRPGFQWHHGSTLVFRLRK